MAVDFQTMEHVFLHSQSITLFHVSKHKYAGLFTSSSHRMVVRDFAKTVPDPNAPVTIRFSCWMENWFGDVDAGLFLKFKGSESSWNEAAPSSESVRPPSSWAGANLTSGSLNISQIGENVQILATSGSSLDLTTPLVFNFTFHVTPVKGDYTYTSEGKYEHYV